MYIYFLIVISLTCTAVTSSDKSYDNFQYMSSGKEDSEPEDDLKNEETSNEASEASSYSNVVIHSSPQRSSNTRSSEREMTSEHGPNLKINFKRPANYESKSTSYRQQPYQSEALTNVPDVHPAVMQKLLKQEPQTFDNTDTEDSQYSRVKPDYRSSEESDHGEEEIDQRGHKFRYVRYNGRNNDKSFRYSPNSLPNHEKPSSFKVGYSIGFGSQNGHMRPQNTQAPTSFHMEGKNSVWKQLGPNVEMSEQPRFPYKMYGNSHKQNNPESQFYYMKTTDNLDNLPTSGRMTFDHEHALGQSNPFDFTNAIDPTSGNPIMMSHDERQYASNFQNPEIQHDSREGKYSHSSMPNQKNFNPPKLGFNLNLFTANSNIPQIRPDKNLSPIPLGQNLYAGGFNYNPFPIIQQMYIQGKSGNGQVIPAILIPVSQGPSAPQGNMFMKYNFGGPQPYFGVQDNPPMGTMRSNTFSRPAFLPQNLVISPGNRGFNMPMGQIPIALATQGSQMSGPIALHLGIGPNPPEMNRYPRDSDADSSTIMVKSDEVLTFGQRDPKSLNYKSPSGPPAAYVHIFKSSRPTRDLSHTPIISTILDKVYSASPKTLSGATIILKET